MWDGLEALFQYHDSEPAGLETGAEAFRSSSHGLSDTGDAQEAGRMDEAGGCSTANSHQGIGVFCVLFLLGLARLREEGRVR